MEALGTRKTRNSEEISSTRFVRGIIHPLQLISQPDKHWRYVESTTKTKRHPMQTVSLIFQRHRGRIELISHCGLLHLFFPHMLLNYPDGMKLRNRASALTKVAGRLIHYWFAFHHLHPFYFSMFDSNATFRRKRRPGRQICSFFRDRRLCRVWGLKKGHLRVIWMHRSLQMNTSYFSSSRNCPSPQLLPWSGQHSHATDGHRARRIKERDTFIPTICRLCRKMSTSKQAALFPLGLPRVIVDYRKSIPCFPNSVQKKSFHNCSREGKKISIRSLSAIFEIEADRRWQTSSIVVENHNVARRGYV